MTSKKKKSILVKIFQFLRGRTVKTVVFQVKVVQFTQKTHQYGEFLIDWPLYGSRYVPATVPSNHIACGKTWDSK